MAKLITCATGNFTAAGTWQTCDTNGDNIATLGNAVALTTSVVYTPTFTPGAITVDGVLLCLSYRNGTTGTMTVELYNHTDSASVASVTVNVSDLPPVTNGKIGYVFFHFADQTLIAGKAYKIGASTSSSSQVTLYRGSSTAGDFSKAIRTTTTAAPGAGDYLYIPAEFNSTSSVNTYTVTMDNNDTTIFANIYATGSNSGTSTLTWKYDANTQLQLSGYLNSYAGGLITIGTAANPIGASYTAQIVFNSASVMGMFSQDTGLTHWYGDNSRSIDWCRLNADSLTGATSLTVDTDLSTNWKNGDVLCLASTDRDYSHCEKITMGADSNGTSLPTVSALSYDHEGGGTNADVKAEIGNLTRNIKFSMTGGGSWTMYYIGSGAPNGTWAEFSGFGYNGNVFNNQKTGNAVFQYNSFYDFTATNSTASWSAGNVSNTFSNNIVYNWPGGVFGSFGATSGAHTINHNLMCLTTNSLFSAILVFTRDVGSTITNNAAAGIRKGYCLYLNENAAFGTITGNVGHSGSGIAFYSNSTSSPANLFDSSNIAYRNDTGFLVSGWVGTGVAVSGLKSFQNTTDNVKLASASGGWSFTSCTLTGSASYATTNALNIENYISASPLTISSCSMDTGVTNGINISAAVNPQISSYNTLFPSVPITGLSNLTWDEDYSIGGYFRSSKHNQVVGDYYFACKYGTIMNGATYRTSAPSEQITPTDATNKVHSAFKRVGVTNGANKTVSVYIYKSAAYNGNQPRLRLRANTVAGVSDTTLATATGGTEVWEQLTGTISTHTNTCQIEIYIDCDGANGTLSISDWSVS
ncbi:MAG: hypothetical protein A4E53_01723 [Pelotomaculum sp. PtaB.Bin104]|nr:MAG: hypothetical protein A4E53_01723 [Pelotomaculum sp. PtaB.Bin104]